MAVNPVIVLLVPIRPVNGKRGLVEVETIYRTDWYEEPQP
jgi:hypothetical protein